MGKHSGEEVNGQWINFYTLNGTYTVLAHEQPAKMCSASYGLPANAPGGYGCEDIYNATKISVDGIYLHELTTTIWAQDNGYDVSHGCLNLNTANSWWYYTHSTIGDPVEIHAAKGAPTLQEWEGGDWTIPWATWVKGSAL
jgi:lipoprotein-anchoring transpeptidase ErfK/SrfK